MFTFYTQKSFKIAEQHAQRKDFSRNGSLYQYEHITSIMTKEILNHSFGTRSEGARG